MSEQEMGVTPITLAAQQSVHKAGVDWHHCATMISKEMAKLERENQRLQKELAAEWRTVEILRYELTNPPPDVQELVIRKLNLVAAESRDQWKTCACEAVAAMNGTVKRLRLALAEATGSEFDIPDAPSASENIKAVAAVNAAFDRLNEVGL